MRIPVQNPNGTPAMPTKSSRARKWVRDGKAIGKWSDIGLYYVQLIIEPLSYHIQPVVIGVDPGKLYSGIAVQSSKFTLFTAHLILPFNTVKKRMEQRAIMRRSRRGRRIDRKVKFKLRAHRQMRFNNRRNEKLPPSIRANRQLELRVIIELNQIFPLTQIVYEYVQAKRGKSFSPVIVGQLWILEQLKLIAPTVTKFSWETSNLRDQLRLVKQKTQKGTAIFTTHPVGGIALASSYFIKYQPFIDSRRYGHLWVGKITLTNSIFKVIRRPPINRRQLHSIVPSKGKIRHKYGELIAKHGFRKGDLVNSPKGISYISGDTKEQICISDFHWKQLGQIAATKISLIRHSNGLIIS